MSPLIRLFLAFTCCVLTTYAAQSSVTSITVQLLEGKRETLPLYRLEFFDKDNFTIKMWMSDVFRRFAQITGETNQEDFAKTHQAKSPFKLYTLGVSQGERYELADLDLMGGEKDTAMKQFFMDTDLQQFLTAFDALQRPFVPKGLFGTVFEMVTDMTYTKVFAYEKSTKTTETNLVFVFNVTNDAPSRYTPTHTSKLFNSWRTYLPTPPENMHIPMAHTHTPIKSVCARVTEIGARMRKVTSIEFFSTEIVDKLPETREALVVRLDFADPQ
eukprot:GDKI01020723.1.p1 GENE.GDKI01020723.1~~GDKI01020723.1.p1  ORF type:complete len:272 (+),score=77.20 GDKI01020723.1:83-898(+)